MIKKKIKKEVIELDWPRGRRRKRLKTLVKKARSYQKILENNQQEEEKRLKKEELAKYSRNINIQVLRFDIGSLNDQMKVGMT